jgi:hypothetical protein
MPPLSIAQTGYYAAALFVVFGGIVGSYFASRAGVRATLENILGRIHKLEVADISIQEAITKLNHALGYLEGRINGKHQGER